MKLIKRNYLTTLIDIIGTPESSSIPTNYNSVGNYIEDLCESFYKISRYDIRGKRYLTSV